MQGAVCWTYLAGTITAESEPLERVLIVGEIGCVGSMLTPTLLAQGYQVTISESLVYGALPVLGFSRFQNLQIITRKVRDRTELAKAIEDHDWVLHLAVVVGYSACAANPQLSVSTNVDGTRNVPDSMGKGQRLIFASTGSTYEKVEWVANRGHSDRTAHSLPEIRT